jgi:uncharacterized integral membrane protein (TIGR00698 family)
MPSAASQPGTSSPSLGERPTKFLFLALGALTLTPWVSPPVALAMGLVFGLVFRNPFARQSKRLSRILLQASVVALGFGMNLFEIVHAGRSGFTYTALGIAFAMLLGTTLGKLLRVDPTASFLISTGTAICGGSAIAAVGPIIGANDEEMSVSLGTVFVLNSIALLTFPAIGAALKLSQTQFGLWAALAIHDTSSVVGAATKYGAVALAVGTTVKLARALWIVPLSLGTAALKRTKARIQWPWFILLFALAAVLNTYVPSGAAVFKTLAHAGRIGLTLTLFLIGSGISRATLKQVGPRPLLQGVLLWIAVGLTSLWLIVAGIVHL